MPISETGIPLDTRPAALAVVLLRALDLLERSVSFGRDADLVQLVEVDPLLRGSVLRIVRTPVYSAATHDLTVPGALERIGPDPLVDALRALQPERRPRDREHADMRVRCWLHGIAVAAAARWLANQGAYDDPEKAYLAGLAHGLVHGHGDAVVTPLLRRLRLGERVESAVRLTRLFCHEAADAELVLDGVAVDAGARALFRLTSRADEIAASLGYAPAADAPPAPSDAGDPDLPPVSEAMMLELAHAAGLLGLAPLPWDDLVEELVRRELAAHATLTDPMFRRPDRGYDRLAVAQREILASRGAASIPELLERGLSMLHGALDFDRVVVLEREHGNPTAARVRAVACRTGLPGPGPRSLVEVAVSADGVLARALESQRSERSTPADDDVLSFLGAGECVVVPLRAGTGAVGLLVADHFLTGRPVTESDSSTLEVAAGTLGLVLENVALQAEGKTLRALAEKDALTGISNRRNILEILRREIDRARRYGKPLSVALLDVDHFKTWNDLHGHHVGDSVLQAVAQILSSCGREADSCGRYGGEEFLVVLPETSADHAVLFAERLRQAVENHGFDLAERYAPASLTVSIGITQLLPRGDDPDRMVQRADRALYAAKEHGRNRVCLEAAIGNAPSSSVPSRILSVLDEI